MTRPGVGPVTALATEVFLGDPARFTDGKTLASYVGIIPSEYSSGGRQRLGGLSKQGNALLRFLWGGVRRRYTRYAGIRSCSVSTTANWSRRAWRRREWQWLANSGSGWGSCCEIRLSTTSSVVADRGNRKAVKPVRGCLKRRMVRTVTDRLIRIPASLAEEGVRISSNKSSWSIVTEEMVGGQHRVDETETG